MDSETRMLLKVEFSPYVEAVAKKHGLTPMQILGVQRARKLVDARCDLAHRLRDKGLSTPEIGAVMDRCHTTICHYLGTTKKGEIYAKKFDRDRFKASS